MATRLKHIWYVSFEIATPPTATWAESAPFALLGAKIKVEDAGDTRKSMAETVLVMADILPLSMGLWRKLFFAMAVII
jgi:hypothetical protein